MNRAYRVNSQSAGKSEMIDQEIIEAVDSGKTVLIMSPDGNRIRSKAEFTVVESETNK